MPKISVIIPAYNVESYLEKCIQSVSVQTIQDIEILIINDGSTDQSGAICERYANKDRRIKLIHTPNRGVSAARNLGMKYASGEWLCFVDGDDSLPADALEKLYLSGTNADIVIGNFFVRTSNGQIVYNKRNKGNDAKDKAQLYRLIGYTVGSYDCTGATDIFNTASPWGKLYRRSFCESKKLAFPPLKRSQDMIFNICAYQKTERIVFTDYPVYYYHIHEESVVHRYVPDYENTAKQILDYLYNALPTDKGLPFSELYDFCKQKQLVENIYRTYAHPLCPVSQKEKLRGIKRLCSVYDVKAGRLKINRRRMSPRLQILLGLLAHRRYGTALCLFEMKKLL